MSARAPDAIARFEREARAVAALSHPNILAIHDFGTAGGVTYAVMELLDGESLRAGARRRAAAAAQGGRLRDADRARPRRGPRQGHRPSRHQAGECLPHHRRPRQDSRFRPRPSRFAGHRRRNASRRRSTARPSRALVLGTVGYMAPEQVRGGAGRFAAPTSSRSARCSTRWSPAGARFSGETAAETMTAILREDPPEARDGRRAAGDRAHRAALPREEARGALPLGARSRVRARSILGHTSASTPNLASAGVGGSDQHAGHDRLALAVAALAASRSQPPRACGTAGARRRIRCAPRRSNRRGSGS